MVAQGSDAINACLEALANYENASFEKIDGVMCVSDAYSGRGIFAEGKTAHREHTDLRGGVSHWIRQVNMATMSAILQTEQQTIALAIS